MEQVLLKSDNQKNKAFNLISTAVAKAAKAWLARKLQGRVQPSITTEAIWKVLLMVLQHEPSSLLALEELSCGSLLVHAQLQGPENLESICSA